MSKYFLGPTTVSCQNRRHMYDRSYIFYGRILTIFPHCGNNFSCYFFHHSRATTGISCFLGRACNSVFGASYLDGGRRLLYIWGELHFSAGGFFGLCREKGANGSQSHWRTFYELHKIVQNEPIWFVVSSGVGVFPSCC